LNIALALLPTLVTEGLTFYVNILRLRAEKEGRTEVTLEDIEALKLEDPEDIIKKYRESQGLS